VSSRVRLLGVLEVEDDDVAIDLHGPKERRLLAAMALHRGEVVSESGLIDALWGGEPPRTATKTLQNHVLRLRRSTRRCGDLAVVTRSPGYRFDGDTDVAAVERAVAGARRAVERGDHGDALALFDLALAQWRGPSLQEFADLPFARTEAVRLEELREAVREDRVEAVLHLGRHHEAVTELEDLVEQCPLRERRWHQLMVALYRDGRQAEALGRYRRLRAVLAEQLGVEPGPEARATEAAILAHDPALRPPRPRRERPVARPPAPCVGRTRELEAVLAGVDGLAAGGAVVLVVGEAGIGKSRLLAEVAVLAAPRATVLTGRCLEGAGARPFQPFAEALPPAGTASPSGAGGEAHLRPDEVRARVFDGVVRHVVALSDASPLVLLLDDLHWADADTVALLRHVVRSTTSHPVLVVGAYREQEIDADHPLDDAVAAMRTETECSVLRLRGIDGAAIGDLLAAVADAPLADELATAIAAETGGNPFFAREVVRHLQEIGTLVPDGDGVLRADLAGSGTPDGAGHVIARRRRRLSAEANALLDTAAAIEGPFLWEPVRVVAGVGEDPALAALDEVLAAGLVVVGSLPDQYDFVHALVRHAVYGALNPSRRRRRHRALAEAMDAARRRGEPVSAAEIAVQFHRAGRLPGAEAGVAPALEAAERARRAGAHDEQAEFLRMALDLLPVGDVRRAELGARRAEALAWSLRFDEAVTVTRDATGEDDGCPAAAVAEVATVLATAGSNRHAWALAPFGLRACRGPDGPDAESWAALTLLDLDRREADDPTHPGMPLDLPGRRTALEILYRSGRLVGRGDLARYAVAAVFGRRERIPDEAARDPSVATFLLGDYALGARGFADEAEAAHARGQLAWEVYCRSGAGRSLVALGEFAAAATEIARSGALVDRLPGLGLGWQLLHHQGAEDARTMALDLGWPERLAAFAPWMQPGPERQWGRAAIAAIGARIHARRGHAHAALGLLSAPVHALQRAPAWAPNHGRTACEIAEALWLLDRRDHLSVVESALRDKALPADFRFPMTDARLAMARLCALDARHDEAHRWFTAARDVLDHQGARPLRAVVDHDEALMHLRAGDRAAAEPFVEAAAAAFERLGMAGWTRRLEGVTG
jgi:DNA-binding SARP family transcriptional activator